MTTQTRGPLTDRAYATLIAASFARLADRDPEAAAKLRDMAPRVSLGVAFANRVRMSRARKVTPAGRTLLADTFRHLSDLLEGKPVR